MLFYFAPMWPKSYHHIGPQGTFSSHRTLSKTLIHTHMHVQLIYIDPDVFILLTYIHTYGTVVFKHTYVKVVCYRNKWRIQWNLLALLVYLLIIFLINKCLHRSGYAETFYRIISEGCSRVFSDLALARYYIWIQSSTEYSDQVPL